MSRSYKHTPVYEAKGNRSKDDPASRKLDRYQKCYRRK